MGRGREITADCVLESSLGFCGEDGGMEYVFVVLFSLGMEEGGIVPSWCLVSSTYTLAASYGAGFAGRENSLYKGKNHGSASSNCTNRLRIQQMVQEKVQL